jgi:hypothetical protein
MRRSGPTFVGMRADMLLMGGQKCPAFLRGILDALEEALPRARRVEPQGVGHQASLNRAASDRFGEECPRFLAGPDEPSDRNGADDRRDPCRTAARTRSNANGEEGKEQR